MSDASAVETTISNLVLANRILAREDVIDDFGHVSARHPSDPGRFFLSRSRSPQVVTRDDIMEFELDGALIPKDARRMYSERFIHGAIYMARPDVNVAMINSVEIYISAYLAVFVFETEKRPSILIVAATVLAPAGVILVATG